MEEEKAPRAAPARGGLGTQRGGAAEPPLWEGRAERWKVPGKGRTRNRSQLTWSGGAGILSLLCWAQTCRTKAARVLPDEKVRAGQVRGCPATRTQEQDSRGPGPRSACPCPSGRTAWAWALCDAALQPQEAPGGQSWNGPFLLQVTAPLSRAQVTGHHLHTTMQTAPGCSALLSLQTADSNSKQHLSARTLKNSVCRGTHHHHPRQTQCASFSEFTLKEEISEMS